MLWQAKIFSSPDEALTYAAGLLKVGMTIPQYAPRVVAHGVEGGIKLFYGNPTADADADAGIIPGWEKTSPPNL